jgi:hypothetical protein
MRRPTRAESPFLRILPLTLTVAVLLSACSSGDSKESTDTTAQSPASGPMSAPQAFESPNPPNPSSIVCPDNGPLLHDAAGLPTDIDQWLLLEVEGTNPLVDGGSHPAGWRLLQTPPEVTLRASPPPSRMTARSDLAALEPAPDRTEAFDSQVFTMHPIVDQLLAADLGGVATIAVPLNDYAMFGAWSTSAILYERVDGSLDVIGNCPLVTQRALTAVITAGRDAGMTGSDLAILTSLSQSELADLAAGALQD